MADYPSFPDLAKKPFSPGVKQGFMDNTLASTMENGLVMTRPRSGGPLKRTWSITYRNNPEIDRAIIEDFFRSTVQGAAGIFYWRDPRPPNSVVLVRFTPGKALEIADDGFATQKDGTRGQTYSWTLELQEV